jgi:chorismate lyase/3-hydroxybenzoate synthase
MTACLQVALTKAPTPPTDLSQLLVAFHFGTGSPGLDPPGVVATGLRPIGHDELYEAWWINGSVQHSTVGSIRIAESKHLSVFSFHSDATDIDSFADFTFHAYRELLRTVRSAKHASLAKIWNYMGGINIGVGDDERYRQFSIGRARAFDEIGIMDQVAPAGTGIGSCESHGLSIIALASSSAPTLVENPRQISAFDYPRQYGPRSPKFGRGASMHLPDCRVGLISGTASIVGHDSLHPDDTQAQLAETVRNLRALCGSYCADEIDSRMLNLGENSILRVYLRNPCDYESVASQLNHAFPPGEFNAAFLQGDICRSELSIEIDGVQIDSRPTSL